MNNHIGVRSYIDAISAIEAYTNMKPVKTTMYIHINPPKPPSVRPKVLTLGHVNTSQSLADHGISRELAFPGPHQHHGEPHDGDETKVALRLSVRRGPNAGWLRTFSSCFFPNRYMSPSSICVRLMLDLGAP